MEQKIIVAVKGLILYHDKILLIKRSSYEKSGADTWECSGGKLEFGEGLEEGLKREIKEETGLEAKVKELLYATTFQTHTWRQVVILTYLCEVESDQVILSKEHTDYRFVSKNQLDGLLDPNILEDMIKNAVFEKILL